MTQLETAVKRAGSKHRWEKKQQALKSGEMNQINVPYLSLIHISFLPPL